MYVVYDSKWRWVAESISIAIRDIYKTRRRHRHDIYEHRKISTIEKIEVAIRFHFPLSFYMYSSTIYRICFAK